MREALFFIQAKKGLCKSVFLGACLFLGTGTVFAAPGDACSGSYDTALEQYITDVLNGVYTDPSVPAGSYTP